MPMRVSSATSVRTAVSRSAASSSPATRALSAAWAPSKKPPSSSAVARIDCRPGAACVTISCACAKRSRLGQPLHGGVDLRGGVGALGHLDVPGGATGGAYPRAQERRASSAPQSSAGEQAGRAGRRARLVDGQRHQQQHAADHAGAEQVAFRSPGRGAAHAPGESPRRRAARAPRRSRRPPAGSSRARPPPRLPPAPPSAKRTSGASAPCRRSSSEPNSSTASTHVAAYQRSLAKNGAVATRHQSPSIGPTTATSTSGNAPVAIAPAAQRIASAIETTGRCAGSARIPGISPGCRRGEARLRARRPLPASASSLALELRRALAQPRAAVRALGDVRARPRTRSSCTRRRDRARESLAPIVLGAQGCESGLSRGSGRASTRGWAGTEFATKRRRRRPRASR